MNLSSRREVPELPDGQQPEIFIPGLTASAWWDSGEFSWLGALEASTADITSEFLAAGGFGGGGVVSQPSELTDQGRWTALYLYCIGKAYSRNVELCPVTMRALAAVPGATAAGGGMCYFSIMEPRTHVSAHTGYTNAHLRCHLGLVVPGGSRLRVGGEIREWEQGKAFVFDDSFEHEAWNDAESGRAVLLFDLWHPDLTDLEVRALAHMTGVWRRLTARSFWSAELARS
ncbi:aspartyl/asparaginyl beta-hydroxylase domain-containing protein [Amycolatopsis sp. A133]|uniref:aspartyl/asparaginyl beta-hydroxylase domain-containing protein n=1 Tax=Amycolatopsis sp. A133 TaxID=3064472 RepID=UPI0027E81B72|nr:aspartyl/asparaginyl beta-hydroxylase domain-containing protein [Amycolatopsis sp. A133]MDQ7809138.1 aspartyl/asparaginyl beta-hydroxylase domain-containing protein [Amycolatopsis sp. A133]